MNKELKYINAFLTFKDATPDETTNEIKFQGVISAGISDREQEVLLPDGMDITDFKSNPVMIWHHDYSIPAIGTWTNLRPQGNIIVGEARVSQATQFSREIGALIAEGTLRGLSVGFIPVEWRNPTPLDLEKWPDATMVYSKWKLLEITVCNLPCNQQALISAVSKGIVSKDTVTKTFGVEMPEVAPVATPEPVIEKPVITDKDEMAKALTELQEKEIAQATIEKTQTQTDIDNREEIDKAWNELEKVPADAMDSWVITLVEEEKPLDVKALIKGIDFNKLIADEIRGYKKLY